MNNLRLPWKTELPRNFHCWIYFLHSGVLSNLRMLWKTEGVLNIYFLLFRIFEQLALVLKNRVTLEFFTVLNILFAFRIFEELALALKIRVCPEYIFFIIQEFWATCACPEKELPWNFSLYWICIFYHSGFLRNLRLPWKQSLPWNFSSAGGGRPPRLVRLWCHCFFCNHWMQDPSIYHWNIHATGARIKVGLPFFRSHTNGAMPLSNAVLLRLTFYNG